jgi:hypothetical protein
MLAVLRWAARGGFCDFFLAICAHFRSTPCGLRLPGGMGMRQALNRRSAGWRGAENRGDRGQRWLRRRGRSARLIIIKCYWMRHRIIVDIVCPGKSGGIKGG